jgi:hypothetical protein
VGDGRETMASASEVISQSIDLLVDEAERAECAKNVPPAPRG